MSWELIGGVELERCQVFRVDSERLGVPIEVSVAVPAGRGDLPATASVLYVLDPYLWYRNVVEVSRSLRQFSGLPATIVVGVAHAPSNDPYFVEYWSLRARDFTPCAGVLPASINPLPLKLGTGRADTFLDFLIEDLFPEVEQRFAADPADRTVLGWSFSGLFALHALFTRPAVFQRYLAVSPSLPWADGVMLGEAEAHARSNAELRKDVFICAGASEDTVEIARDGWVVTPFHNRLYDTLVNRGYAGLRLQMPLLEGESHFTAGYAAISRGLRFLFGRR